MIDGKIEIWDLRYFETKYNYGCFVKIKKVQIGLQGKTMLLDELEKSVSLVQMVLSLHC